MENGFSVAFFRLEELLAAMRRDAGVAPARLRRRKYVNVALLVMDKVGFEPMSRQDASLLFRLVSYRYKRDSIVLTTDKGIRDWPEILAAKSAAFSVFDTVPADTRIPRKRTRKSRTFRRPKKGCDRFVRTISSCTTGDSVFGRALGRSASSSAFGPPSW